MTRSCLFACLAALVLAACQSALPQGPTLADELAHSFLNLDNDRDGYLSRLEASASPLLERRFAYADADGDGLLARSEYNSPGWRIPQ